MVSLVQTEATAARSNAAHIQKVAECRAPFPERLEIDDNQSLCVSQMPDYRPRAPLRENISADLAVIGDGAL